MQVLRPPIRCGRWRGPCSVDGLRQADLATLLDFIGGRSRVWRKKASSGMIPDPHATAIGGCSSLFHFRLFLYLWCLLLIV